MSVNDIYIPTIGLPILQQENMWTDPGNIYINRSQTHECRNWDFLFLGINEWDFRCSVYVTADLSVISLS